MFSVHGTYLNIIMYLLINVFTFAIIFFQVHGELYIDNFQKDGDVSSWSEHSDTDMLGGRSKSSFVLQRTSLSRRAILFTMLNPQSCGAAIAGINKSVHLDVSKYKTISMKIKGQGQYKGYEFFMRHSGETGNDVPTYVHYFEAPSDFEVVNLPIAEFRPYLKGMLVEKEKPLARDHITSVGILAYGGVHLAKKQHGVAGLEIDWIKFE